MNAPVDVRAWLESQERKELLRFITCGSVDDGKSTLIGRLLFETRAIFDDQLAALEADSRRHGTQGEEIVAEMLLTKTSERQGRAIDKDAGSASMEKKKQEGYF